MHLEHFGAVVGPARGHARVLGLAGGRVVVAAGVGASYVGVAAAFADHQPGAHAVAPRRPALAGDVVEAVQARAAVGLAQHLRSHFLYHYRVAEDHFARGGASVGGGGSVGCVPGLDREVVGADHRGQFLVFCAMRGSCAR